MKKTKITASLLVLVVLLVLPVLVEQLFVMSNPGMTARVITRNVDYYMHIAINAALFASAGVAWNLVGGYARQVSLGHGIFLGLGAYTSSILLIHNNVPFWVGTLAGILVAVCFGFVMGMSVFRLKGHYFAISTIAFCMILRILAENDRLKFLTGGSEGINILPNQTAFLNSSSMYYASLLLLLISLGIVYVINKSRLGYYLVAMGQDEQAAMAVGISIRKVKQIVLAISASLTAVVGAIYGQFLGTFSPQSVFDVNISTQFALFAIIGGIGTMFGPVVGAAIIVPVIAITEQYFGRGHELIFGLLLIVMVLWKPGGLVPWIRFRFAELNKKRRKKAKTDQFSSFTNVGQEGLDHANQDA